MKVAIIGGGITGLVAIKACLEEGIEPQCFEKTDQIGGLWVYRPDDRTGPDGPAGAYRDLRANTSIFNFDLSDFPSNITDMLPNHDQYIQHYNNYAQNFKLKNYVKLNATVLNVEEDGEHWLVTWQSNDEKPQTDKYNAVFVCTGRFHKPIVPKIDGIEEFEGNVLIGNQYKHGDQEEVRGKRVVIVGNSFTAGDIASLSADQAKQVYLSLGSNGCSHVSVFVDGVPFDSLTMNRGVVFRTDPMKTFTKLLQDGYKQSFAEQEQYGIKLYGKMMMSRPMLYTSNDLPSKIRLHRVVAKPKLVKLTKNVAHFDDGTAVDADTVIIATGYDISFPFLSKDIIADTAEELQLYKLMWPLTTKRPNLAVLGCLKFIGVHSMFAELQARWAVQVVLGNRELPDKKTMKQEIDTRVNNIRQFLGHHSGETDSPVLVYQDYMASEIGCLPTWWHYLLTSPLLAYILRYGPAFPSTYRLTGAHSWPGAEERTLELYKRWRQLPGIRRQRRRFWFKVCGLVSVMGVVGFVGYRHGDRCWEFVGRYVPRFGLKNGLNA